jgi:hypothetical protein
MRALCAFVVLGLAARVDAAPQHWPFSFDPAIARDPAGTGQKITTGNQTYPDIDVSRLVALQSDQVTLYLWPELAAMLERARSHATDAPMVWPLTPVMCVAHAAFSVPPLLVPNPSAACQSADAMVRTTLADTSACADVEFPELYALGYQPGNARDTSKNIVDMIGQAGEAWAHAPAPQQGILPDDWVPTLRTILDKLRGGALVQHVMAAQTAYTQALQQLAANAACFDPTAVATVSNALQAMQGELLAALQHLADLDTSGNAARMAEERCLAAKSRVRNTVTYPSLTRAEREWIAFWVGGTYWRMRGGGLIPLGSTQDARWYFVNLAFSQIGQLLGGQDGTDAAFQLYLPLLFTGWSDWQDMGNDPNGNDRYDDLVSMCARGETQVHGAVTTLAGRGYHTLDLTVGGLQMGAGYYRGYYPMGDFRYAAQIQPQPPYSDGISGPTCIGEFSIGASMGLGLAHVLLDGKDSGMPPIDLCAGKACGDDGCGGSCGSCGDGTSCTAGQCVAAAGPDGAPNDAPLVESPHAGGGCCDASGGDPLGLLIACAAVAGSRAVRRRASPRRRSSSNHR